MAFFNLSFVSVVVALVACCWISFRHQPVRYTKDNSDDFVRRYGDWAIVAGASEGLGAAWASELCGLGVNVLLVARRENEIKKVANYLQSKYPKILVDTLVQDLSAANLQEVFYSVINGNERKYGLLIYNAAHSIIGPFIDSSLEIQHKTVDVNVRGVLTLCHVLSNHIRARTGEGGIILMSSLSGELGTAGISNYAGTKAWNTAFAHGLSHELSPLGIDVMACVAGPVTTPNYIKASIQEGRNNVIEQTAEEVVSECIQAIGSHSSIRTGFVNKISRFFVMRLLLMEMAIRVFNEEAAKVLKSS